ncbi:hypothetical protein T06_14327 [Trichinella sp. T6]|nr:hypothetical protein T06_14327 [Trichinella sp. T6]
MCLGGGAADVKEYPPFVITLRITPFACIPNPSMDDQSTKLDRAQVDRMLRLIFSTQFHYHPPKLDYITNHLENE